ncbi:ABC transporter permease subunit [Desertimonas flava]|uniref:branched-chain amino acid ABC transporter ATP-binding protein/permease n=1 Tax=Desertimonas flava TaxID=2064846 RepID=UPI000E3553BA|nr:branched-chain amino acid ABC transporter ATP-binding protein/permease [Desertimonas flava]
MIEESTLILIAINGVLAYSFYAVLIAGQLSLAQIGCAGVAAFTAAKAVPDDTVAGFIPPLAVSVAIGMCVGAAAAFLIGIPVMRLRGVFLAIATLGFAEMARITLNNMSWTGGALGMRVDKLITLPIAIGLLAAVAYWFARQRRSRLGRALAAVREDELAALAMGIDVVRYRLISYVTAGAIAGLYGVMYAHFTRFIEPNNFNFPAAVDGLVKAVVGGTAVFVGPVLGSAFFEFIPDIQRALNIEAGWIRPFIAGALLLAVILFLPGGFASLVPVTRRGRHRPQRAEAIGAGDAAVAVGRQDPGSLGDAAPLVRVRGMGKSYGGVHAVRHVDLDVLPGEIVGLIGPNGAGKTTLVNMLSGLVAPTVGDGDVLGVRLDQSTRADRVSRAGMSRTFQHAKLFTRLTALENVLVGAHHVTRPTFLRRLVWMPSAARDEEDALAHAWVQLERVGLGERATSLAGELAYGDQRRLEIARALASNPSLLILDEPAAGMNHVEASALGRLIAGLPDQGVSVLLIEHNVRMVLATCTRVVVLNFGEVIASGTPDEIAADETVIEAYLGSDAPVGDDR